MSKYEDFLEVSKSLDKVEVPTENRVIRITEEGDKALRKVETDA